MSSARRSHKIRAFVIAAAASATLVTGAIATADHGASAGNSLSVHSDGNSFRVHADGNSLQVQPEGNSL